MKKQIFSWLAMGLYAVMAILWTIRWVILLTTSRYHGPSETEALLNALCAGIWWIAFLMQVIGYRNRKKDDL